VRPTLLARARKAASVALIGGSAAFVLAYLAVALSRMGYPFELEWMEGGMLDHVRRVMDGLPIYPKPSIEFVSFLYPPLYYDVAACVSRVVGPGFTSLRLVSFLSSLGVFTLLFAIVRRETGRVFPGILAVGLFAATYDRVGGWFDLARLDSFYLLLLLSGVYALRFASMARGAIAAGVLIGAAFLTKQSALVIALPLVVAASLADVRRGAWFTGAAGLAMGGGAWLADFSSGGWFHYYCVYLPSRHPRLDGGWSSFWTVDLLPALPLATMLAAGYAATRVPANGGRRRFFFPLAAAGMIGSSWSVRNMVGAEVNNLLPAFAAVALLAALAVDEVARREAASPAMIWRSTALAVQLALIAQLALLAYDPRRHLPHPADRAAGERLVGRLAAIEGEIFVPHHGYLAHLAGKNGYAHTLAMDNVFLDDDGPARQDLQAGLVEALAARRFAAVVLESDGRYAPLILSAYEARERLFDDPNVFWPVTGGRLRPEALCLPKAAAP